MVALCSRRLIDQILVLLNPLVGFRFLGEGKKESVEFATRRLSGRVCRRVEGVVEELLEESSSLPLVVGGDGGGGGDLPVRIEPKMRKEEVCRFLDLQSGDVLGNEVFQKVRCINRRVISPSSSSVTFGAMWSMARRSLSLGGVGWLKLSPQEPRPAGVARWRTVCQAHFVSRVSQ